MKILTEQETLDAASRMSLARYGDGELRVAIGGTCYGHRERNAKAVAELRAILAKPQNNLLVGIPRYNVGPNAENWDKYRAPQFLRLYNAATVYGSAFVTRPDSAPWIDTSGYWAQVRALWEGKDVVLVAGSSKSLTADMLSGAGNIRVVSGPVDGAYSEIDRIEEEIGKPSGSVLMCLGVAATILAARLSAKGVHALDLGHIGMFMKRYEKVDHVNQDDLISNGYRAANRELHNRPEGFGGSGWKHSDAIRAFIAELKPKELLDYGCGEGTLKKSLKEKDRPLKLFIHEYDPAINAKSKLPRPAGLVVCTDVLEHVEPDRLDAVLQHLCDLSIKGAYLAIATRPANKLLPDGSNAHLIIESAEWWVEKVAKFGWTISRWENRKNRDVVLWITK